MSSAKKVSAATARPAPPNHVYLQHLQTSSQTLGAMLMTEQNIAFYQQLMQAMRDAIEEGRFAASGTNFRHDYLG